MSREVQPGEVMCRHCGWVERIEGPEDEFDLRGWARSHLASEVHALGRALLIHAREQGIDHD